MCLKNAEEILITDKDIYCVKYVNKIGNKYQADFHYRFSYELGIQPETVDIKIRQTTTFLGDIIEEGYHSWALLTNPGHINLLCIIPKGSQYSKGDENGFPGYCSNNIIPLAYNKNGFSNLQINILYYKKLFLSWFIK